jgi:hypothetical protein
MGNSIFYKPPTTPVKKEDSWDKLGIMDLFKSLKDPADLTRKADKALSDYVFSTRPDLTKYGSEGASALTDIYDAERKSLLESVAKEGEIAKNKEKNAMLDMAKPSQEFQQQMKGREVALRRASGDLLGAQEAMQDENYGLGSGSALRQKPQPIAPEWTKMNRAARRLRRQGYTREAGQMASLAEVERLGTPNLMTQDQRNRMSFMDMERDVKDEEQRRQANLYDMYLRRRQQQAIEGMI